MTVEDDYALWDRLCDKHEAELEEALRKTDRQTADAAIDFIKFYRNGVWNSIEDLNIDDFAELVMKHPEYKER